MQDLKFNIHKHVQWKKDVDHVPFMDRGEWKAKEGRLKERYWQFECADAYGKLVTLNANPAGVHQFIEQLLRLDLLNHAQPAEFVMPQEIEARKCLEGEAYQAFDDGRTEEERDEDCVYFGSCGNENLTGYRLGYSSLPKNVAVNRVIVKWYPQAPGRLMALSLNPDQFQVTLHLNRVGYSDWRYIMALYRDRYAHFDLFKPRQRIIDKFGDSRYYLTDCPAGCEEVPLVHFQVWKDCDLPKIINLLSYSFIREGRKKELTEERAGHAPALSSAGNKIYFEAVGGAVLTPKEFARFVARGGREADSPKIYEGPQEERLFLQASPRGYLELEAVLLTCIERFPTRDYLDYHITCPQAEYEWEAHDFEADEALCEGKRKRFNRVRFVFLRCDNLHLFSAEYDEKNDLVYFYLSYSELFKWLDKLSAWQSHDAYLEYEWNVKNNMSEQAFIASHQDQEGNRSHLAHIRYGHPSWHKFPFMEVLSCVTRGELFSVKPLPGSQCWPQPREHHEEYNVYRCPAHAFIIDLPHAFMINPIATLKPPWGDQ